MYYDDSWAVRDLADTIYNEINSYRTRGEKRFREMN